MSRNPGTLLLLSLVLAACAGSGPPRLDPVGDVIPVGVSLEGHWQLRGAPDDVERRIRRSEYRSSSGKRGADSPSVYVFLRTGSRLKITQTPYALFISFDRSVVEEYRFRERRRVNVGPIEADRASGWVEGKYVIRTLDSEGALLEESYALESPGDALVRTVSISYRNEEILSLRQAYDRME
jgi:hypothetical protein